VAYSNGSEQAFAQKLGGRDSYQVNYLLRSISNIVPPPASSVPSRHTSTSVISKMLANNRRDTNKGTQNKATKPLDTSAAATCACPATTTVFHSLSPCHSLPECQHHTVKHIIGQNPTGSSHSSVSIQSGPSTVCTVYTAHNMDTAPTY
jgi:hypothetical protein